MTPSASRSSATSAGMACGWDGKSYQQYMGPDATTILICPCFFPDEESSAWLSRVILHTETRRCAGSASDNRLKLLTSRDQGGCVLRGVAIGYVYVGGGNGGVRSPYFQSPMRRRSPFSRQTEYLPRKKSELHGNFEALINEEQFECWAVCAHRHR